MHGSGKQTWTNGRSYDGGWYMNKMHGKGVFIWEDGRKYSGDYYDD